MYNIAHKSKYILHLFIAYLAYAIHIFIFLVFLIVIPYICMSIPDTTEFVSEF